MTNYINADKLKAEIERQQRRLILLSHTEQVDMRRDCALQNGVYDNILSIIASLQQKQPEVDLEKEIDKYCEPIQAWQIQEAPYTSIENCARHFYELGLKARKEE